MGESQFKVEPFTDAERDYVRAGVKLARMRVIIKQCYYNSQRLVTLGDPGKRLLYAEGTTGRGGQLVPHGWAVLDGRKVVDVTLRASDFGLRVYVPPAIKKDPRYRADIATPAPEVYSGATFTAADIHAFMQRTGCWGRLTEEYATD